MFYQNHPLYLGFLPLLMLFGCTLFCQWEEHEGGSHDFLWAQPRPRWSFVFARLLALSGIALLYCFCIFIFSLLLPCFVGGGEELFYPLPAYFFHRPLFLYLLLAAGLFLLFSLLFISLGLCFGSLFSRKSSALFNDLVVVISFFAFVRRANSKLMENFDRWDPYRHLLSYTTRLNEGMPSRGPAYPLDKTLFITLLSIGFLVVLAVVLDQKIGTGKSITKEDSRYTGKAWENLKIWRSSHVALIFGLSCFFLVVQFFLQYQDVHRFQEIYLTDNLSRFRLETLLEDTQGMESAGLNSDPGKRFFHRKSSRSHPSVSEKRKRVTHPL